MQHDFNLVANGSQTIDVAGKFFKYKSGTGNIRVKDSKGGFIDLTPGQGVYGLDYTSLTVVDKSGATNSGVILAGMFDFRDDTIAGSVQVIDGGKARTLSDRACFGYAGMAAGAALYSHVQLFNPATSGVNLSVSQVAVSQSTGTILMARYDAPLTTLSRQGQRKRIGSSTSSAAEVHVQQNATQLFTGTVLGAIDPTVKIFKMTEPIIVMPGTGLIVFSNIVNDAVGCTMEFFEDPI